MADKYNYAEKRSFCTPLVIKKNERKFYCRICNLQSIACTSQSGISHFRTERHQRCAGEARVAGTLKDLSVVEIQRNEQRTPRPNDYRR